MSSNIDRNFKFIESKDGICSDIYKEAEEILSKDHCYLLPVVDEKGKLLYAYQECNRNISWFLQVYQPRLNFQDIVQTANFFEQCATSDKVYLCSNLGNDRRSISIEEIKKLEQNSVVFIGFDEDYLAMRAVSACIHFGVRYRGYIPNYHGGLVPYFKTDKKAMDAFQVLVQENGKYFDWIDFENIFQAIRQTQHLSGSYVEIGTYRGDSAKAALEYIKQLGIDRKCFFLDTYEGFNYQTAEDSQDSLWKNTHGDTSIDLVQYRLRKYVNWKCIKCNIIENNLPNAIGDIVVCNIDVDIYEAYVSALEKVRDHIVRGGIILAEDFGHTPSLIGGQYAIMEFAKKYSNEFIAIYAKGSQLLLIKK